MRKEVLPARYHSAAGVIFGVMMVQHLVVNALGLWPARYQAVVNRIHGLCSLLPWLSVTLVFLPLAVHVGFGLKMLRGAGFAYHTGKHRRRRPAFPPPARVGRDSVLGVSRSTYRDVARLGISPDLPADGLGWAQGVRDVGPLSILTRPIRPRPAPFATSRVPPDRCRPAT